jgi:hypothetical protein
MLQSEGLVGGLPNAPEVHVSALPEPVRPKAETVAGVLQPQNGLLCYVSIVKMDALDICAPPLRGMQQHEPEVAVVQQSCDEKYAKPNELAPSEAQMLPNHEK